jgi:HlyD family secretion protein
LTRDAVEVRPGARAIVDRWGGPPLDARVRLVEPSAFTRLSALGVEEQRVNVVIDIVAPREQWRSLGDGYRVEAHIVVWEEPQVVKVPASAVFRHEAGWALFRDDGGVARLTAVSIGKRTPSDVQIVGGITPPASVIVYPSDRVTDGVKVRPRAAIQ